MTTHRSGAAGRLAAMALLPAIALGLAACGGAGASSSGEESTDAEGADLTTLTVGFNAGPYEDQFTQGIQPILEAQGYEIETQTFTDGIQVNAALADGQIQANIMQHSVYMDYVNDQRGFDNTALVQVPSPPRWDCSPARRTARRPLTARRWPCRTSRRTCTGPCCSSRRSDG